MAGSSQRRAGVLYKCAAVFIFGLLGVSAKIVQVPPLILVLSLQVVGCVILFFVCWRKQLLSLERSSIGPLLLATISITITDLSYFSAIKLLPVANATLLKFTSSIFLFIFAAVFLHEKIRKVSALGLLMGLTGLLLVLWANISSSLSWLGVLYGFVSAFSIVAFVYFVKSVLVKVPAPTWLFYRYLIASLVLIPVILVSKSMPQSFSMTTLAILCGFGLLFAVIASLFDMQALRLLSYQDIGVLSYLEPMLTIVYGILLISEPLTLTIAIGSILIIGGSFITTRFT